MGSTAWNKKRGVLCAACKLWLDSDNPDKTPNHKPKGDILSLKDCPGSGRKPKNSKGFEGGIYPYNKKRGR